MTLRRLFLFSESPSRYLISVKEENVQEVLDRFQGEAKEIGIVTEDKKIEIKTKDQRIQGNVKDYEKIYEEALSWELKNS